MENLENEDVVSNVDRMVVELLERGRIAEPPVDAIGLAQGRSAWSSAWIAGNPSGAGPSEPRALVRSTCGRSRARSGTSGPSLRRSVAT